MSQSVICPCGKPNTAGSRFCAECGQPLWTSYTADAGARLQRPGPPLIWLETICSLIIPLYGWARGFILAFHPDPEFRRAAGYCFAGALVSGVAWALVFAFLPLIERVLKWP